MGDVPAIRVLLVEDDPAIRTMALHALRDQAMDVAVAETGVEALELISRERFDAIVLDLAIPGYSGLAILENLRRSNPGLLHRVIVTTAYAPRLDETDRRNVFKVLVKPFDVETLCASVRGAVRSALA